MGRSRELLIILAVAQVAGQALHLARLKCRLELVKVEPFPKQ